MGRTPHNKKRDQRGTTPREGHGRASLVWKVQNGLNVNSYQNVYFSIFNYQKLIKDMLLTSFFLKFYN